MATVQGTAHTGRTGWSYREAVHLERSICPTNWSFCPMSGCAR